MTNDALTSFGIFVRGVAAVIIVGFASAYATKVLLRWLFSSEGEGALVLCALVGVSAALGTGFVWGAVHMEDGK